MAQNTEDERVPSRSARKREAQAVEGLARRLVELPQAERERIPLEPELRAELQQVVSIRQPAARDRQLRHLAGLLRRHEESLPALEEFLAGQHQQQRDERQHFHRLEQWRDQLCAPDSFSRTLEEVARQLPKLDVQELSRQARLAQNGQRPAFREVFRLLRQAAG